MNYKIRFNCFISELKRLRFSRINQRLHSRVRRRTVCCETRESIYVYEHSNGIGEVNGIRILPVFRRVFICFHVFTATMLTRIASNRFENMRKHYEIPVSFSVSKDILTNAAMESGNCNEYCFLFYRRLRGFLKPAEKCDMIKMIIFVSCAYIYSYIDTSVLYHVIKSQSVIKLYIFFNMLEVGDRLFASFVQDTLGN